MGRPRFVKG
jgi:hypothetical protein